MWNYCLRWPQKRIFSRRLGLCRMWNQKVIHPFFSAYPIAGGGIGHETGYTLHTHTPMVNLESSLNRTEGMFLDTQGQGEHARSTRKGPNLNLNPEPSCLEVPVRTTAPPCHKTERQCWFIFFILGWLRGLFYCDFARSSYVCLVEFRIQISHRSEWLWFPRFPDCSSSSPPSTLNWISGQ